jgi:hypothetical protein
MNTISRSWAKFTGWNANCWDLFNDEPYFGGNGFVGRAWNGFVDDVSNINGTCIQAFSTYGNPGNLKRWTMTRPILRASGSPVVSGAMSVDFDMTFNTSPLSFSPVVYGAWDSSIWDSGVFGADFNIYQAWQGVSGVGYYGAPQMKIASSGIDVRWVSTDVVYESGAIL